jgi:hypothetical protein
VLTDLDRYRQAARLEEEGLLFRCPICNAPGESPCDLRRHSEDMLSFASLMALRGMDLSGPKERP